MIDEIKRLKEQEQTDIQFDQILELKKLESQSNQLIKVSDDKVEIKIGVLLIALGVLFFAALNLENVLAYWWMIFFLKPFLWFGFGKMPFGMCGYRKS